MNKHYIILGALLFTGILVFASTKNTAPKAKRILFVGDSNTAAAYGPADQLRKLAPNVTIKKIAQNGAKTEWMKTQLMNELKTNKYDVVVILGGSNDIYGGEKLNDTMNNLNSMYDLIHSKGAKVFGITPPNKDYYVGKTEANQNELNALVNWMKSNKKIDYFIDFKKLTANKNYFSVADGFQHPTAQAYNLLAGNIKTKLDLI